MTPKAIAGLCAKMKPKQIMLNSDAVWEWRLERAAELGAISVLSKSYKEFSNPFKRDW